MDQVVGGVVEVFAEVFVEAWGVEGYGCGGGVDACDGAGFEAKGDVKWYLGVWVG